MSVPPPKTEMKAGVAEVGYMPVATNVMAAMAAPEVSALN
jgi:hypothetical protein